MNWAQMIVPGSLLLAAAIALGVKQGRSSNVRTCALRLLLSAGACGATAALVSQLPAMISGGAKVPVGPPSAATLAVLTTGALAVVASGLWFVVCLAALATAQLRPAPAGHTVRTERRETIA